MAGRNGDRIFERERDERALREKTYDRRQELAAAEAKNAWYQQALSPDAKQRRLAARAIALYWPADGRTRLLFQTLQADDDEEVRTIARDGLSRLETFEQDLRRAKPGPAK